MNLSIKVRRNKALIMYCAVSLMLLPFVIIVFLSNGQWFELSDAWEHAATVRELSHNLLHPQHPYLSIPGLTTSRNTVYILILVLLSRLLNISALQILNGFAFVNLGLFLLGVYLFFSYYTRNPWSSVFAALVLPFFWGMGWYSASNYNFNFLLLSLFFPFVLSFSLCFLGWFFFLKWLREAKIPNLILFLLLGILAFNIHPVTGSLFYLFLFCLLADRDIPINNGVIAILLSVIALAAFSLLWPYNNIIRDIFTGIGTEWCPFRMKDELFNNIPTRAGFALLGIPLFIWIAKRREYYAVLLAFFLCVAVSFLSRVSTLNLIERYVIFSLFFCQCAIILYLTHIWGDKNIVTTAKVQKFQKVCSMLCVAAAVFFQSRLFFLNTSYHCAMHLGPIFRLTTCNSPHEKYSLLIDNLHAGDVVMSDPVTSWVIPAITGAKVIVPYHNIPFNEKRGEQEADAKIFFDRITSANERKKIIEKHGATHIVINKRLPVFPLLDVLRELNLSIPVWNDDLVSALKALGEAHIDNRDFIIIKLKQYA